MTIKLYWCRGSGRDNPSAQNFGDYLSPLLVELLSGQKVVYEPVKTADLIAIGSVLGREKKARRFGFRRTLDIWGPGVGEEHESFSGHHRYHAVRGRHSLERIKNNVASNITLGDPGLLADSLVNRLPEKRIKVGIIPHYADQQSPLVQQLHNALPGSKVINVFDSVRSVLEQISSCELVISSSMHGLIVADAYGIPNRRIKLSNGIISNIKFKDYYSCFSLDEPEPFSVFNIVNGSFDIFSEIENYDRPGIDQIKNRLLASFPFKKLEI